MILDMEFLPLHTCPNYMTECAEVLNEEWKRSLTARLHSLEKSRDSMPVCLVLLEPQDGQTKHVVGHSRVSDIQGQPQKSCLVESVVVKKSHRGKGYGRLIMEHTEQFAASKGYQVMYLTTHDKQDFYKHLGYEFCSPVVMMSMDIIPDHLAKQLLENLSKHCEGNASRTDKGDLVKNGHNDSLSPNCSSDLPLQTDNYSAVNSSQSNIVNSSMTETSPPVAPPPPPPSVQVPSPPPVLKSSVTKRSENNTVVRWDPSKVSWMKKIL